MPINGRLQDSRINQVGGFRKRQRNPASRFLNRHHIVCEYMQKKINALTFFCTKFRQRKLLYLHGVLSWGFILRGLPQILEQRTPPKACVLFGPRRHGKTTMLRMFANRGICLGMTETIVYSTSLALFIRPIEALRAWSANTQPQSAPSADVDQWLSSKPSDQPVLWRPKAPTQSCYPCGMQQAR